MRRSIAGLTCTMAVVLLALVGATPATGSEVGAGHATSYSVALNVRPDGALDVAESITYAFDDVGHGVERFIPVSYWYDETRDRVIEVDHVTVSSSTGAPVDLLQENESDEVYLRIGDPDQLVRGTQSYEVQYTVTGALTARPGRDELSWNAIGERWGTPIDSATVMVTAPQIENVRCSYGEAGSDQSCATDVIEQTDGGDAVATFGPVALSANEGLTVVVAMPQGAVAVPPPILVDRWSVARAFAVTPLTVGLTAALLVVGGAGVAWLARRGSDEVAVGRIAGGSTAPAGGNEPVDWRAVREMRPGLVGTLVDERADVVDVTATIVDLAVRRHLRIEELPSGRRSGKRDWRLVRLDRPQDDDLLPYEELLLVELFHDRSSVRLEHLEEHFHQQLRRLRGELYVEVVRRRWYRSRPDRTRMVWYGVGAAAVVAAGGVAALLAIFTSYGLVGVGLVLPAVALLAVAHALPVRTAEGSAALRQVLALRHYLETAQAQQLRAEDAQRVFSQLMPYAMVFGKAQHWTAAFRSLAATGKGTGMATGAFIPYWYVATHDGWDVTDLGSALSSFASSAGSAMSATPADSGSSGGVGSGGGGGGGGGW